MSTPSHPPPNVRLQLSPHPENVALIRTTLAGVAEAIDLPPQALDDVRTAVTEAANNVVLHAYQGDHHNGSLEVDTHIAPNALTVIVRDEGVGITPQVSGRDGVEPRQVELRVGPLPLPAGHSDEAIVDSVLGELAPVIERLADDHSLAPAGPASMLALQLVDRR